jgi:hypothetical protein
MPGAGHKSIRPGQRALVWLKRGTSFVDRFLEDKDVHLVFEEHGRVASALVRTVSVYRPLEGSQRLGEDLRRTCALCGNTYQAREAERMALVSGKAVCRGCARTIRDPGRVSLDQGGDTHDHRDDL